VEELVGALVAQVVDSPVLAVSVPVLEVALEANAHSVWMKERLLVAV